MQLIALNMLVQMLNFGIVINTYLFRLKINSDRLTKFMILKSNSFSQF